MSADNRDGKHDNKGVDIAKTVVLVGLAIVLVWFLAGPALSSFGQGVKSFMMDVGLGIRANPTLSIIILAIPVGMLLGLIFMAVKALTSSSSS